MSNFVFDNDNEFDENKLLSIKKKTKLKRSIYNKPGKEINKNNNDIDTNESDMSSSNNNDNSESESESDKSIEEISTGEKTINLSTLKYHELRVISEIKDLILPRKDNKMRTNLMDISDDDDNYTYDTNHIEIYKKKFLPCRIEEQKDIYNYIKNGLKTNGNYNSLYICGTNGTGKTESVKKVIDIIEEENYRNNDIAFRSLFINCVNFDTNRKLIKYIYNFIFSKKAPKIEAAKYLNILDKFFSERNKYNGNINLNDPSNSHIILIMDEIDYLIDKYQLMLYHIFNWTLYPNSKLIIISISNIVNINNLLLEKIVSRFGHNKLLFKPYTKEQIREIINYQGINLTLFDEDALKLTSMKVAAINGDLRRVIHILKYAKELYNNDIYKKNLINKIYIIQACNDLFDNKIIIALKNLQLIEKIVIGAILFNIGKNNDCFVKVENIYESIDILFDKYNEYNKNKGNLGLDINWDEFKMIIYNLKRMKIIEFRESDIINFKDNLILIKFYSDEFFMACESDEDFKPVFIFLTNSLN